MGDPLKFTTAAQWRRWLARHHDTETEIWLAFAKKGSGKETITYHEALDEALCFGWVDNLKKRLDDDYYLFRFVPRKVSSKWSQVNLDKFGGLEKGGRVARPGPRREARERQAAAAVPVRRPRSRLHRA